MRKPSVLVIFLTVFIDLVGFGIVLPVLPLYSDYFGAGGLMIGTIIASYSVMQFLFAPFWGQLSDRFGRRPVLLTSTAGATLSYAVFAWGSSLSGQTALLVLLLSRVLAGVCGANISVAQAYIADISLPEQRSKRMGLIGMAFGLGFIFGPAIGGLSTHFLGMTGPGWIASGLCGANFFLALTILGESWQPNSQQAPSRPQWRQWTHTLRQPKIGLLIGVLFIATFCFACFETTLGLLVASNFNLHREEAGDAKTISLLFAYCGLIGAAVQGGAIGRLIKLFGEVKLIALSLVLAAVSLAILPFVTSWTGLLLALALLSIGSGLTRPPVFGLISILTPPHEQGATIGVAQSAASLSRIPGPLFAAGLFDYSHALPYVACGLFTLFACIWAWQGLCRQEPIQNPAS